MDANRVIDKAKELSLIDSEAGDFKSRILIKLIMSKLNIINSDKSKTFRLMAGVFGKTPAQIKSLYSSNDDANFSQFYRLARKIENAVA